jgi:hypothetical protein
MRLFVYRPLEFTPLIFIISKINDNEMLEKFEASFNDVFQILIDEKFATNTNILIFSAIKDYDKTTQNYVLPSTKSNNDIIEKCHNNTKFLNILIKQTLINFPTSFYLDFDNMNVLYHQECLHLEDLSFFYKN